MIPLTYFRSSSYSCHNMCQMKFFNEYILGHTGKGGIAADKGTIVHKVMEILANVKKAVQDGKKTFHDKDIKMRVSLTTDIDKIIDRVYEYYTTAFSYHDWTDKHYKECRKWSYMCVENQEGEFDPRKRNIVEVEGHFDLPIPNDWAFYDYEIDGKTVVGQLSLKGTIDLVTQIDDDTYEVIDWKTGQRKDWATGKEYTHATLRDNMQLRIYHYALSMMYPDIKCIMITINYIRNGGPYTITFDRDDIPETLRRIKDKFELIKNTDVPKLSKSWKCTKFCDAGMTTFEGTNVKPITETRIGQRTPVGEYMTKCEQTLYTLQHRPVDTVMKHMTKEGHDITHYRDPGSIE